MIETTTGAILAVVTDVAIGVRVVAGSVASMVLLVLEWEETQCLQLAGLECGGQFCR